MQVKSLFIKDFQQFKDFELDLTYPAGQELAGQPLKKVCIIGQSGTGKTTLLRFLKEMTYLQAYRDVGTHDYVRVRVQQNRNFTGSKIEVCMYPLNYTLKISFDKNQQDATVQTYSGSNVSCYSGTRGGESVTFELYKYLGENKICNLFIPAEIGYKFNDTLNKKESIFNGEALIENNSIDLSNIPFNEFKKEFFETKIALFQEALIQKRNEFAKLATNSTTTNEQLTNEALKLKIWEEQRTNPLKKLGEEFLDRILNHFNLRVKTEVDFQDIGFIKLETLQGQAVESDIWSTGTKQIILTALPLYALKPKNSIILFDEPERSLYPDIQTKIIDFYTSLAPDSQFFFATHSPLIASCFEPWEIVELKFNEEGKVYREQYYEGENHVDNYKFYPQYLRYDTILSKVFDLPNSGNKERKKILDELAILKTQMKNGVSEDKKQALWETYQKLQKKVSWENDDEKY